jgi:hypothetical protein
MATDMTVANTILRQMGGAGRLKAMTGANSFVGTENSVSFRWPSQRPSTGNAIRITLDPDDTYTVDFLRVNKNGAESVKRLEGIYADQLMDIFERQTGLYLTFAPRV